MVYATPFIKIALSPSDKVALSHRLTSYFGTKVVPSHRLTSYFGTQVVPSHRLTSYFGAQVVPFNRLTSYFGVQVVPSHRLTSYFGAHLDACQIILDVSAISFISKILFFSSCEAVMILLQSRILLTSKCLVQYSHPYRFSTLFSDVSVNCWNSVCGKR